MSRKISLQDIWYNSYNWCIILVYTFFAVSGINMYDIPLSSFTGGNVTYPLGVEFATPVFVYTPKNATTYWLRCFQGNYGSKMKHFLSYSFVKTKVSAVGEIGERTKITIEKSNNEVLIKLNILQPNSSDDGQYCCELEGVEKGAKKACLQLDGHATQLNERNGPSKAIPEITGRKWVKTTTEMIPHGNNYNFFTWVCLAVVSPCILIASALIIYVRKTRKKPKNNIRRQEEEDPMV